MATTKNRDQETQGQATGQRTAAERQPDDTRQDLKDDSQDRAPRGRLVRSAGQINYEPPRPAYEVPQDELDRQSVITSSLPGTRVGTVESPSLGDDLIPGSANTTPEVDVFEQDRVGPPKRGE
jgi:hypothetical protein